MSFWIGLVGCWRLLFGSLLFCCHLFRSLLFSYQIFAFDILFLRFSCLFCSFVVVDTTIDVTFVCLYLWMLFYSSIFFCLCIELITISRVCFGYGDSQVRKLWKLSVYGINIQWLSFLSITKATILPPSFIQSTCHCWTAPMSTGVQKIRWKLSCVCLWVYAMLLVWPF